MGLEAAGLAQICVTVEENSRLFDLRYYSSEEYLVPAWWLGVVDAEGDLQRTAVLAGSDRRPVEVFDWLKPMVGAEAAARLVELARTAAMQAVGQRERVASSS